MLSAREIKPVVMPLSPTEELAHPERTIMIFGTLDAIDIGAFCFTKRAPTQKISGKEGARLRIGTLVELKSFDSSRVPMVREAIRFFSELIVSGGKRISTTGRIAGIFGQFLNFSEANEYAEVLTDTSTVGAAYRAYLTNLKARIDKGTLSPRTAMDYRSAVLTVLSGLMGLDSLHDGNIQISARNASRNVTQPPAEEDQAKVLSICHALFEGLTDLCVENHPYPYALTVPSFMNVPDNTLHIFPLRQWCMPPHQLAKRENLGTPNWSIDFANGTVFSVKEVEVRYSTKHAAERAIAEAWEKIKQGNASNHNLFRRNAAFTAHHAFVILFTAHTGMNGATISSLPWEENYDVGVERQGFRAIKFRAGGRLVSFEIQSRFLQSFKKFLRLRAYLLNDRKFDFLFMGRPINARSIAPSFDLKPLDSTATWFFFEILRSIEPSLTVIGSRKFRAAKSDWLLRNVDPATTAVILQNSVHTVMRSYAEGSPVTQEDEFSNYFDSLYSTVLAKDICVDNGVELPIGICSSHGEPRQYAPAPIQSDCQSPEGCLFCDKFKVHADEIDIRKLVSCRYCIERTAHLADSQEQHELLFDPIFQRIEEILSEIERISPGIVARIVSEVEAGELDPYWSRKLEMLISLGMVI